MPKYEIQFMLFQLFDDWDDIVEQTNIKFCQRMSDIAR